MDSAPPEESNIPFSRWKSAAHVCEARGDGIVKKERHGDAFVLLMWPLVSAFKRGPRPQKTTPSFNKWKEFFFFTICDLNIHIYRNISLPSWVLTFHDPSAYCRLFIPDVYFLLLVQLCPPVTAPFSVEQVVILILWETAEMHHLHVNSQARVSLLLYLKCFWHKRKQFCMKCEA